MRIGLGLALLAGVSLASEADVLGEWNISGYNTLRGEHYSASGDLAGSPYASLGAQFYDEFGLDMQRRVSPYESWQGSFSGVANTSDYRSSERGGVLERARLVWEKGDAGLPYRLEMGDFQAGLSPRVIQRSLKGVQVEMQPGTAGRHSVQLFSGLATPIYRNMNDNREQASGLSWLLEDATLGGFSLSAVRTARAAATTLPEYQQDTWGLGWGRQFQLGGHDIEAEAEWAHFSGEHAAAGTVQEDRGDGLFAQITGQARPFDYRLRHARYDTGFRPLGGAVAADQRASEAYLGWVSAQGMQVRGRLIDVSDNRAGGNPLATQTFGLSLAGLPLGGFSTWLDLSQQAREDRNHSVDGVSRVVSLSLGRSLSASLNLRGSLQWNDSEDLLAGSHGISRQGQLALDYAYATASGWNGSVSPGLLVRRSTGGSDQTDYNPTLRFALRRDRHDFSASWSHYQQDAHFTGGADSLIRQSSLNYAWTGKAHRFDLEASHFDRDPTPGATTSAYRLAATWTWRFDRPAVLAAQGEAVQISREGGLPRLDELLPGGELAAVRQRLGQTGLSAPGREVYDVTLLEGVSLRQRLLLLHDGERLERSALLLDYPPGAAPAEMASQYQRVAEALYKQLGTPEQRVDEGEFTANLAPDLMQGRFKRWIEWRTAGGVLRLGIPHRTDGAPRMEIVHARSFTTGTHWGVELAD